MAESGSLPFYDALQHKNAPPIPPHADHQDLRASPRPLFSWRSHLSAPVLSGDCSCPDGTALHPEAKGWMMWVHLSVWDNSSFRALCWICWNSLWMSCLSPSRLPPFLTSISQERLPNPSACDSGEPHLRPPVLSLSVVFAPPAIAHSSDLLSTLFPLKCSHLGSQWLENGCWWVNMLPKKSKLYGNHTCS